VSANGSVEVEDALAECRAAGVDGVRVVEVGGVTEKGGFIRYKGDKGKAHVLGTHRHASPETASLAS
jgi:hypothetical protein